MHQLPTLDQEIIEKEEYLTQTQKCYHILIFYINIAFQYFYLKRSSLSSTLFDLLLPSNEAINNLGSEGTLLKIV